MKIDININHHCGHGCVSCVVGESNRFLNELLKKQKPFFSEKKAKKCVEIIEQNPMESNEDKWKKIKDIVDDTAHEVEVGDIQYKGNFVTKQTYCQTCKGVMGESESSVYCQKCYLRDVEGKFHDGKGNCGECYPDGNCRYGV